MNDADIVVSYATPAPPVVTVRSSAVAEKLHFYITLQNLHTSHLMMMTDEAPAVLIFSGSLVYTQYNRLLISY